MRLTIDITEDEAKILKKRGKKNFLKLKEQVEDIVRRSCMSTKTTSASGKCDDQFVNIFSRQRRLKPRKKKKR